MKSSYYEKTNTLMCNFICVVDSEDLIKLMRKLIKQNGFLLKRH